MVSWGQMVLVGGASDTPRGWADLGGKRGLAFSVEAVCVFSMLVLLYIVVLYIVNFRES